MTPWFSPMQLITALGVTGIPFLFYSYRIYHLITAHHESLAEMLPRKRDSHEEAARKEEWIRRELAAGWNEDDTRIKLVMTRIFLLFDEKIGVFRRSLRSDVYIVILIGFIGTLIGMITSFSTLLFSVGNSGMDPADALGALLRGGLSTALVSSLAAAVLACTAMAYLSFTEKAVSAVKGRINAICLEELDEAPREAGS